MVISGCSWPGESLWFGTALSWVIWRKDDLRRLSCATPFLSKHSCRNWLPNRRSEKAFQVAKHHHDHLTASSIHSGQCWPALWQNRKVVPWCWHMDLNWSYKFRISSRPSVKRDSFMTTNLRRMHYHECPMKHPLVAFSLWYYNVSEQWWCKLRCSQSAHKELWSFPHRSWGTNESEHLGG